MKKTLGFLIFMALTVSLVCAAFTGLFSGDHLRVAGDATASGYYVHVAVDSTDTFNVDTFNSNILHLLDSGYISIDMFIDVATMTRADSAADSADFTFNLMTSPVSSSSDNTVVHKLGTVSLAHVAAGDTAWIHIHPDTVAKYLGPFTYLQTITSDSTIMGTGGIDSNSYQILLHAVCKTKEYWR